jgi:hypothetical protein
MQSLLWVEAPCLFTSNFGVAANLDFIHLVVEPRH